MSKIKLFKIVSPLHYVETRELLKEEEPNLDDILRVAKVFETVAEQKKS